MKEQKLNVKQTDRVLGHQLAKKLTEEELKEISGAAGDYTPTGSPESDCDAATQLN